MGPVCLASMNMATAVCPAPRNFLAALGRGKGGWEQSGGPGAGRKELGPVVGGPRFRQTLYSGKKSRVTYAGNPSRCALNRLCHLRRESHRYSFKTDRDSGLAVCPLGDLGPLISSLPSVASPSEHGDVSRATPEHLPFPDTFPGAGDTTGNKTDTSPCLVGLTLSG